MSEDNLPQEFLDELQQQMSSIDVDAASKTLLSNMAEEYKKGNFKEVHRYALLSAYDTDGKMFKDPVTHSIDGFSVETQPSLNRIVLTQSEFFKVTEKELFDNLEPLKQSRDTFIASVTSVNGDSVDLVKKEIRGFIAKLLLSARSDRAAQVTLYLMLENPDVFDIENEILTCGTDIYPILVSRDCFIYHHPEMKDTVKIVEEAVVFDYEISEEGDFNDPGFEDEGRTVTVTYTFKHTLIEDQRSIPSFGDADIGDTDILFVTAGEGFAPDHSDEARFDKLKDDIKSLNFIADYKLTSERKYELAGFSDEDLGERLTLANIYYVKFLDELSLKFVSTEIVSESHLRCNRTCNVDPDKALVITGHESGIALINACLSGDLDEARVNYEIDAEVKFVKGKGTQRSYSALRFLESDDPNKKTQGSVYSISTLLNNADGTVIKDCLLSHFSVSLSV